MAASTSIVAGSAGWGRRQSRGEFYRSYLVPETTASLLLQPHEPRGDHPRGHAKWTSHRRRRASSLGCFDDSEARGTTGIRKIVAKTQARYGIRTDDHRRTEQRVTSTEDTEAFDSTCARIGKAWIVPLIIIIIIQCSPIELKHQKSVVTSWKPAEVSVGLLGTTDAPLPRVAWVLRIHAANIRCCAFPAWKPWRAEAAPRQRPRLRCR